MERNYPNISVTDKAARSLRSGHPWVYADEVLHADAACENGQLVDVTTRSGHWLGAGFYNSASAFACSHAMRTIALMRHSGRGVSSMRSITAVRSWARILTIAA